MTCNRNEHHERSGRPLLLAAAAALATLIATLPLGAQGFSGKVVDESGRPLGAVAVDYTRLPTMVVKPRAGTSPGVRAPGDPDRSGTLQSHTDGTFSTTGLPPGDYMLCVHAPSDLFADPCTWNKGRVRVAVGSTGSTAVDPVTVSAGVRIHLSLSDPQGLLPSGQELAPTAVIGVLTGQGAVRRPTTVSRIGNTIDAVLTVPHDQNVSVWAVSSTLKFSDSSGKAVTTTSPAAITPPAGVVDHLVPLSVTK
jgi:hypothetical protein